jgi:hypothetical protein
MDLLIGCNQSGITRGRQCAGRTRLHTFTTGNAGGVSHLIVQIEHDLRLPPRNA